MPEKLEKAPSEFQIQVYSIDSKFDETKSKGRARIFYTGKNRNRTYITEEFARQLLSTIAYAPVKGIWDEEEQDFTTHGATRNLGRIYGIVPESYNLQWEDHNDDDGVTRSYACVDVILYTGLYPEANTILNKSLSMELYPPSIQGTWEYVDGERLYKYSNASFFGLQALGDNVEPCFEGAAFYSLLDKMYEMYAALQQYQMKIEKTEEGGKKAMPALNFNLSDREKYEALFSAVNPSYNEENGWKIDINVCEVYDEYALCYDFEKNEYFRQNYQKDENGIILGERSKCYILDISQEEYEALNRIREGNENSFIKAEENYAAKDTEISALTEASATKDTTVEELNTQIATLQETKTANETRINELQNELDGLHTYKKEIEDNKKKELLDKYALQLDEAIIADYTARIDEFDVINLEKELSYELVRSNPNLFTRDGKGLVPSGTDEPLTGLEAVLEKYK